MSEATKRPKLKIAIIRDSLDFRIYFIKDMQPIYYSVSTNKIPGMIQFHQNLKFHQNLNIAPCCKLITTICQKCILLDVNSINRYTSEKLQKSRSITAQRQPT